MKLHELAAAAHVTRLTSVHSILAQGDPWTVYVSQNDRVSASGRGATEEEALHAALAALGVT